MVKVNKTLFKLKEVLIDKDSWYYKYMLSNVDKFMFNLNTDRLLYNFRRICGLDTKGVESYEGWISIKSNGASQFEMHYVSALARLTQSMPDYKYQQKETALDRLSYMIKELKLCQDNYAKIDPKNAGYLNAFPIENFEIIKTGTRDLPNGTNAWVPWYFMHKTLTGLYDTYLYCTDKEIASLAFKMVVSLAEWCGKFLLDMSAVERENTLKVEYGGMIEVMFNLYKETNNPLFKKSAEFFMESGLYNDILLKKDNLTGIHANTTIPKFLGLCAKYEITEDDETLEICKNFFDMVLSRTYSNGGTSLFEHWGKAGQVELGRLSEETCCSYNMLKLADYLYRFTGEIKYMHYYENTYLNHILSSIDVDTGCKTYFVNSEFGFYKVYHTQDTTFWCCSCTGMESFSKLAYNVFYELENGVEVNLFVPCSLQTEKYALKICNDYIYDEKCNIQVLKDGDYSIKLRIPTWCKETCKVKINGKDIEVDKSTGYIELNYKWEKGDLIEYSLPMEYRLVSKRAFYPTFNATLFYGPIMLVADLGPAGENQQKEHEQTEQTPYSGKISNRVVLESNLKNSITKIIKDDKITFTIKGKNQTLNFVPFFSAFSIRYAMYLDFIL